MYLLDSDHLSILWYGDDAAFAKLDARLDGLPEEQFSISIVSFDEQLRGWRAFVKNSTKSNRVVRGYLELHDLLDRFSKSPIIDFTEAAAETFAELRQKRVRISTMDLRIAQSRSQTT